MLPRGCAGRQRLGFVGFLVKQCRRSITRTWPFGVDLSETAVKLQAVAVDKSKETLSIRSILRFSGGQMKTASDSLIVESPLQLRSRDEPLAILMRTPGHDIELLRGLLHSEGIVRRGERPAELIAESENVVRVDMQVEHLKARWTNHLGISSSACGVCGAAAIAVLEELASPILSDLCWTPQMVAALPDALAEHQPLFEQCGALHGAALFDSSGQVLVSREDVGRHNAVDKVIGWAIENDRLPLSDIVLGVSSRLSYEIVHKAIVAGVPMVVGVSGPSSLAVDLAERWRVTLAGFIRNKNFNVYSHSSRIQQA